MNQKLYRYTFNSSVDFHNVEATLVLAFLAVENLHGETQARLDAAHYLDPKKRACIIDATTAVGRDLNRLFLGFLTREFGRNAFEVKQVRDATRDAELAQPVAA